MIGCSLYGGTFNYAPSIEQEVQKSIVVCIPSYNNADYCLQNLDSVFSQKYENYRVIYCNDASTDETLSLVKGYIEDHSLQNKIQVISNENNRGAMANIYAMIHSLKDEEIVITLDGDDFFAHSGVLDRVNRAYADPNVWVTYGSYLCVPSYKMGHRRPLLFSCLRDRGYRKLKFYWSHLRTCYAGYFKKIPKEWFLDDRGKFFSTACDAAIMIGLMDLCHEHVYFIPEILYYYNRENVLNDDKRSRKEQRAVKNLIYKRKPLPKIPCNGNSFAVL